MEIILLSIVAIIINNLDKGKNPTPLVWGSLKENIILGLSIISLYNILGKILLYNNNNSEYQERYEILGYNYGVDGISILLIGLIGIIEPILLLLTKGEVDNSKDRRDLINKIFIIKILIIIIFSTLDLMIFFIAFELILIPMFLLITKYGSKYNFFLPRLEAGIRFFIYTMVGSILMLLSIIIFYIKFGTTNNELLTIKINALYNNVGYSTLLACIWVFLFFSFLIKIPTYPFHTWLPLAHSDAPTIGSIILAAILLKLASFGILRYSIYIFNPLGNIYIDRVYDQFLPIIYILSILSIIYCTFIPLRALFDFKKIIAYSSIIHMNFSIFGFFSKDLIGLQGSTFLIFTHAFISSALFLLIGILYKRYHSRYLNYFQGLIYTMPLFSFFFLFFSFANMSLPFCSSFLSEFFILLSTLHFNPFICLLLLFSLILSSAFVIWFTNRLLFGSPSSYLIASGFKDLTLIEVLCLFPFFVFTFFFTFFPSLFLSFFTLPLTLLS